MQRKLPSLITTLLVVVTAFAVVGCGGGSDSSESSTAAESSTVAEGSSKSEGSAGGGGHLTTSSLSKAEFTKRVNAICVKRRKSRTAAFEAYLEKHPPPKTGGKMDFNGFVKAIKVSFPPGMEAQVAEIRKLGAPEGDEATLEAFLTELERSVEAARKLKDVNSESSFDRRFSNAGVSAKKYGIDECAVG